MYHHGNGSLEQLEEERRRYGIAPGYQPFNLTQPVFNRPIPTQTVYTQPTWPLPTTAASQNDPYLTSRSPAFNPSPNYQGWNGQGGQPSLPNNLFLPSRSPDFNPPSNYQRWDGRTDHPRLHSEETLLIRLPEKHWVCPNRNGCTKVFKRRHIMCPSCPMSKRKAPGRRKCCRPKCNFLLEHENVADYRTYDSSDIKAHSNSGSEGSREAPRLNIQDMVLSEFSGFGF